MMIDDEKDGDDDDEGGGGHRVAMTVPSSTKASCTDSIPFQRRVAAHLGARPKVGLYWARA